LELMKERKIHGTTHCSIGQEAIAVTCINNLQDKDIVVSNHRGHGHYLIKTRDIKGFFHELMGKDTGCCKGRGGSQHLHNNNFFSSGIQGNLFPVAAGMAYAQMFKKTGAVVCIFIGDGTWGQGVVYETLNMASLWQLPLLVVVENNQYAQYTPVTKTMAGNIRKRAAAFNISYFHLEQDIEAMDAAFHKIIGQVRTKGPAIVECETYRLCPHSKDRDYRDETEIQAARMQDPLKHLSYQLDTQVIERIEKYVAERIADAIR